MGGYFGNGKAWYSWIHHEDICQMFLWAAETPAAEGIYNAVAPHPVRNKALVKAIARAMRQPALFAPAPEFALRLAFGEMADTILNSVRVSAEKVIEAGFRFHFPELDPALEDIFKRLNLDLPCRRPSFGFGKTTINKHPISPHTCELTCCGYSVWQ